MLSIVDSPPPPPRPPHDPPPPRAPAPHGPLPLGRNVPRARGRRTAPAGPVRGGTLLPGEILQECRQGPKEDLIQIAVRNLVAQQVLRHPQLLIRLCPRV